MDKDRFWFHFKTKLKHHNNCTKFFVYSNWAAQVKYYLLLISSSSSSSSIFYSSCTTSRGTSVIRNLHPLLFYVQPNTLLHRSSSSQLVKPSVIFTFCFLQLFLPFSFSVVTKLSRFCFSIWYLYLMSLTCCLLRSFLVVAFCSSNICHVICLGYPQ